MTSRSRVGQSQLFFRAQPCLNILQRFLDGFVGFPEVLHLALEDHEAVGDRLGGEFLEEAAFGGGGRVGGLDERARVGTG